MSVMDLKSEIEQVNDALQISALSGSIGYYRAVFDQAAYADIAMYGEKPTVQEQQDMIHAWSNRVYIANQCAYILTYAHRADCPRNLNFIADNGQCHHGGDLLDNPARLYRMLESIRYNLYSNAGQCMLCREDMDRINNLIEMVGRDIVGEYQRGKVKA